jgi:chitin disaccharide deacetylase
MKHAMPPNNVEPSKHGASTSSASGAAPRRLRKLWLCADDYGISPAVNRAIRDLIGRGRINATSVMVTTPTFSTAEVQALADVAGTDRRAAIGLHLTLTAPFRPTARAYRPVARDGAFPSLAGMFAAGLPQRLDPDALTAEVEHQFAAFQAAFGRPPDYVDGHQHVHLLPQVSDAVLAAIKRTAPRAWIRQCGRAMPRWRRFRDPKGLVLDLLSARLRRRCAAVGVRTNPAFAGTYDFSHDTAFDALFGSFLQGLPDGGVVMCHPGFVDAELERLDVFTTMREREHAFFAGERFPALLAADGIELARLSPESRFDIQRSSLS